MFPRRCVLSVVCDVLCVVLRCCLLVVGRLLAGCLLVACRCVLLCVAVCCGVLLFVVMRCGLWWSAVACYGVVWFVAVGWLLLCADLRCLVLFGVVWCCLLLAVAS